MRIHRALARRHLRMGQTGREIGFERTLRGRTSWDEGSAGHLPMLMIDGVEVTWDELGRVLMTFEDFQFRLDPVLEAEVDSIASKRPNFDDILQHRLPQQLDGF